MRHVIAIIASLIIATLFASCSNMLVTENHDLEAKLNAKAKHVRELTAQLEQKTTETERLRNEIATRDTKIENLNAIIMFDKTNSKDLEAEVRQLTKVNKEQKQQLEAQAAKLRAIQYDLRSAKRERDLWADKFHTTVRNASQVIQMKEGIISRQKKAIEEQNEMMIKYIQQRDLSKECCRNLNSIIKELPRN